MNSAKHRVRVLLAFVFGLLVSSTLYYWLKIHSEKNSPEPDRDPSANPINYLRKNLDSSGTVESLCHHFYQSVCQGKEIVLDPTGSVQSDIKGEVEALRLYEKIIHEHPTWNNEQVDEELVTRIYTPKRKKILLDTYEWIRKRMVKFIEKQSSNSISEEAKKELIRRINNIKLELPPPASIYSNEPDLFTKNDVYYENFTGERRVIRVGGAYLLTAKSWFNRVFTLAHEMSHAIDPCELQMAQIQVSGYQKLLDCFQNDKGIQFGNLSSGCSKNNFVGELFSDWLATRMTVQALEMYASKFRNKEDLINSVINSVKDLCGQESLLTGDSETHPDPKVRVEKIFGVNPDLRNLLGCSTNSEKIISCTLEGKK